MLLELPKSFVPPCGLANCLSSASSTEGCDLPLSVLWDHGVSRLDLRIPPESGIPWNAGEFANLTLSETRPNGDISSTSAPQDTTEPSVVTAEHRSCFCSGATAHGASEDGLFIRASTKEVSLLGTSETQESSTWICRLSAVPTDAACGRIRNVGTVGAIAAADGVTLFFVLDDAGRRGPERLPGSEGHITVAVDVSSSGFLAAATIYGRVAIWRCRSDHGADVGFGDTVTFDPSLDLSMEDRITQLLFSPSNAKNTLLAVAWWSGRVSLYAFEGRWSLAWTRTCPTHASEPYGTCPGTYLAFSKDSCVLAVASGHGLMTFLSVRGGFIVGKIAKHIGTGTRKDKESAHVKGFASCGNQVLTVVRGSHLLKLTAFPEDSQVAESVRQGEEIERRKGIKAITLFENAVATVSILPHGACIEHRGGVGRKLRKVQLPLGATSLSISSPSDDVPFSSGCLFVTTCAASSSYLLLGMRSLLLVHFAKKKSWSAIVSPSDISKCTVGKHGYRSENGATYRVQYLAACYSAEEQRLRFWNLETLQVYAEVKDPLHGPGSILQDIGCCQNASGTFLCLAYKEFAHGATAMTKRAEIDDFELTFFEHVAGNYKKRFVALCCKSLYRYLALDISHPAPSHARIHGVWCQGSDALVCLKFTDAHYAAIVVAMDGDMPRISSQGAWGSAKVPSTEDFVRNIATSPKFRVG